MTHTSTEQPEALRLASALRGYKSMFIESVAADFEAAAKLLEASQAQRVPLSEEQRRAIFDDLWPHGADAGIRKLFTATVFATEAAHGITQEKQG